MDVKMTRRMVRRWLSAQDVHLIWYLLVLMEARMVVVFMGAVTARASRHQHGCPTNYGDLPFEAYAN
jgi:hypothetical protein